MENHNIVIPKVTVEATITQRDDCWAAFIDTLGTFVYSDTLDGIMVEIEDAINDILGAFEGSDSNHHLQAYCDKHGIAYTSVPRPAAFMSDVKVVPDTVRRQPLKVGMEVPIG